MAPLPVVDVDREGRGELRKGVLPVGDEGQRADHQRGARRVRLATPVAAHEGDDL